MEDSKLEYQEVFKRSGVPVTDIQYKLNAIAEEHSEEYGWVVGEPKIYYDENGTTATIEVPLAKYTKDNSRHLR